MANALAEAIGRLAPSARLLLGEPMSNHTTFRVGGPADLLFLPNDAAQLTGALALAREMGAEARVIGNGSNLIVRDGGLAGLTVKLGEAMGAMRAEGNRLYAQAGAQLWQLARLAQACGLAGLEFAAGIPGTVGGAAAMNAGAYGGQLCDHFLQATVYSDGDINIWSKEQMAFGYRTTRALQTGAVVLDAVFELPQGDSEAILQEMKALAQRRRERQPLELPSAGSIFKRPKDCYAGVLIEQAGLKGLRVGGAQVSEKHAGFIVNAGGASAKDVVALIELIQRRVLAQSGVMLEPEVRIIGRDEG